MIWPPLEFRDPARLELALTHASFDGRRNNERFELLGDAALSLAVAQELLARLPDASEGELSRRRAWVVSQPVLAAAAVELDLAARARVGAGIDRMHLPARMLASLYEAVLGAIQQDAGHDAVAAFVRATLRAPLDKACAERFELDPKQELQEWAQARSLGLPQYVLLAEDGSPHARSFQVAVEVAGARHPAAWGRTRKEAERWAAREALLRIAADSNVPHLPSAPSGTTPSTPTDGDAAR